MRGMFQQAAPPSNSGPAITVPAMVPVLSRTPGQNPACTNVHALQQILAPSQQHVSCSLSKKVELRMHGAVASVAVKCHASIPVLHTPFTPIRINNLPGGC